MLMRVLMIHPRLPSSYWSMTRLCRMSGWKALVPPLGLTTLAALLPGEWQIRLVDENVHPLREADWQGADLVMVSGMLLQQAGLLERIREARSRGKTVVAGGPATSSLAESMLAAGCDVVLRGEAEGLVPALLAALETGRTGVIIEASEKPDLTSSPVPRFDLLDMQAYGAMPVQTSRGCPHDCEFCDVVALLGRTPRHKTPDQVIADLESLYRLGWRREIFICDDNFIGNPSHARAVLARLVPWMKSHGEPFVFWTQASIKLGADRELIDLMTEANFATVFVGIESLDDEVLKIAGKHQNVQRPMAESVNAMTSNGLNVIGSFVIGFDGEKPGAGSRIADFIEATHMSQVVLNLLVPLPNTRLWHRLMREGRLVAPTSEAWEAGNTTGGRLLHVPTRPAAEILSEYRGLWEQLQDPAHYLARAYRYFLSMRPTRACLAEEQGHANSRGRTRRWLLLKETPKSMWLFGKLCFALGVMSSCRRLYWTQLVGMFRRNPSRMIRYLRSLAFGLDMFAVRTVMLRRLDDALAEMRSGA
jgi:radical SAM superfamily enzyme YgiQ (UPF0313 family)